MTQFGDDDLDEREDPDEVEMRFDDDGEETPCPYCGKAIYEQAEICPHCRSYINFEDSPRPRMSRWFWAGIILVAVAVLTWVWKGIFF